MQRDTFEAIKELNDLVSAREIEVMLCVANKIDLLEDLDWSDFRVLSIRFRIGGPILFLQEECTEWCFDHGFEFVECSAILSCENSTPIGNLLEVERTGASRVQEALHCNMWRNMQKKANGPRKTQVSQEESSTASAKSETTPCVEEENKITEADVQRLIAKREVCLCHYLHATYHRPPSFWGGKTVFLFFLWDIWGSDDLFFVSHWQHHFSGGSIESD